MTKAELIDKLQKGAGQGMSKKALNALVDELFDTISRSVKKDRKFTYPGFGTWTLKKRAARVGRNPRTGEEIKIKATRTIVFKPAPLLKNGL